MKTLALLLAVLLASVSSTRAADIRGLTPELVGLGTLYVPADDDTYDLGAGMEIQARFWITPYLGLALAAGGADYAIDEQDIRIREQNLAVDANLDGDVGLSPVGVSLLLRPLRTPRVALTLEGGVRYVSVDSNSEIELVSQEPGLRTYVKDTVDIEDGIVAVAVATLEVTLANQVSLIGGAGYQFDLQKGDVEFVDLDLGKNELEAVLVQAGLLIRF